MQTTAYSSLERLGRILAEQYDIQVIHKGNECKTDGRTIYLPAVPQLPEDATKAEKEMLKTFRDALEGKLDHEVSHILFTDWSVVERSYQHPMLKVWTNLMEDARIERMIKEMWPGCRLNLEKTQRFLLDEDLKNWDEVSDEDKSFKVAILYAKKYGDWIADVPEGDKLLEEWDDIKPALEKAAEQPSSLHALALAVWIMDTLHPGWRPKDEETLSSLAPTGRELKKMLGKLMEMEGKSFDDEDDDDDDEDEDESFLETASRKEILRTFKEVYDDEKHADGKTGVEGRREKKALKEMGKRLDELTEDGEALSEMAGSYMHTYGAAGADRYAVYSTEGDRIELAEDGDMQWFQETRSEMRKICGTMVRKLRMALTVQGYSRTEYEKQVGRLDTRRLTRFLTTGNPRCFKQIKKGKTLDVRVCLLVDQSGSMGYGKINEARRAAVLFGDFCESLGIPFEILGFTTGEWRTARQRWNSADKKTQQMFTRWDDLVLYQYKAYNEDWKRVGHRIQGMKAMYHNLDAEAVRVAAQRLLHAGKPGERKVLMVFSDGQPEQSVSDYREHHKEYLRTVMKQLEQSKVEAIGIGILTDAPKHYYPNAVEIANPADLAGTQIEKLRELFDLQGKRTNKIRSRR